MADWDDFEDFPPTPRPLSSTWWNPFPHHHTGSVVCGAVAGLLGGYLFAGHALPLLKRSLDIIYIGRPSVALCVRSSQDWTHGSLAKQCSTAVLASYRKGLRTHRNFVSGPGLSCAWETVLFGRDLLGVHDDRMMRSIEKEAANVRTMTTRVAHHTDPRRFPVLVVGPAPIVTVDTLTDMLRKY